MSDLRGGCQLAAACVKRGSWPRYVAAFVRASSAASHCWLKNHVVAVGEFTADTGPPGRPACPAGPGTGLSTTGIMTDCPDGVAQPDGYRPFQPFSVKVARTRECSS